MRISKNGRPIESVESWFEHAPPKMGRRQWIDGRSAKELAKAFCGSGAVVMPQELASLLDSNPSLGPVEIVEAWPEHKIALDSFRGETRNADLAAVAQGRDGRVAVTVEAKADESFGELIETAVAKANPRSNVPARIEALARSVLGLSTPEVAGLRYQLLHGVAASLVLAREHKAVAAVFVVMEFRGPGCSEGNVRRNESDFGAFMGLLERRGHPLQVARLSGPLSVPGGGSIPTGVPLFLGKAIRHVSGAVA